MKKMTTLLAVLLVSLTATAQTLNIQTGQVTWQFPAAQTGDMTWTDGQTLTVMGKSFNVGDITGMTVDQTVVTDNAITVSYEGTTASVTIAGNVAQYVTPSVSNAPSTVTKRISSGW